jgi:hypothetical protein
MIACVGDPLGAARGTTRLRLFGDVCWAASADVRLAQTVRSCLDLQLGWQLRYLGILYWLPLGVRVAAGRVGGRVAMLCVVFVFVVVVVFRRRLGWAFERLVCWHVAGRHMGSSCSEASARMQCHVVCAALWAQEGGRCADG